MNIDDPCYCPPEITHATFSARSSVAADVHVDRGLIFVFQPRTRVSGRLNLLFRPICAITARTTVFAVLRRIVLPKAAIECVLTLFAKLTKILPPVRFIVVPSGSLAPHVIRGLKGRRIRAFATLVADPFRLRAFKPIPMAARTITAAKCVCNHSVTAVIMRAKTIVLSNAHRIGGLEAELISASRFGPPATKTLNCEAELKCVMTLTPDPTRIPREIVLDAKFT